MITSINISINPRQKMLRERKLPVICITLWLPICIASDWERTSNTLLSPILIVCSQPSACGLKNKTFTAIIVKTNPVKTQYQSLLLSKLTIREGTKNRANLLWWPICLIRFHHLWYLFWQSFHILLNTTFCTSLCHLWKPTSTIMALFGGCSKIKCLSI